MQVTTLRRLPDSVVTYLSRASSSGSREMLRPRWWEMLAERRDLVQEGTLQAGLHRGLKTTPSGRLRYPHFTDEEAEARRAEELDLNMGLSDSQPHT